MNLLILLFIIFFFLLAWRKLEWAVLIVVAALPSYMIRFNILGVPMTLLETMILIVFALWAYTNKNEIKTNITNALRNNKNGVLKIKYPFQWEMIALLIISFIAVGVAGFSTAALGIWKAYFFEPMLFYIVLVNTIGKKFFSCHSRECGNPGLGAPIVDPRLSAEQAGFHGDDKEKVFNLEKLFWPFAVSAISVSLLAIYQKITGQFIFNDLWAATETRRVVSFFGYPNAVGLYLGPLILLFIGWFFSVINNKHSRLSCYSRESGNPGVNAPIVDSRLSAEQAGFHGNDKGMTFQFIKLFFISITILLSLVSIYFARSEGALAGIAAGLVVFGLLAGGKLRWAAIIGVVVISAGIFSYAPARNFAVNKLTLNDFSGQVRKLQWAETWKMLKDGKLITGAGLSEYQEALQPYHVDGFFYNKDNDPDFRRKIVIFDEQYKAKYWQPLEIYMYPHNIILNFWTELGLFGVLLFAWVIIKYFSLLISNFQFPISKQYPISNFQFLKIGLIGAMIALVIHGLVDVPYFKNDLAVMFWIFLAIASVIKLEIKT